MHLLIRCCVMQFHGLVDCTGFLGMCEERVGGNAAPCEKRSFRTASLPRRTAMCTGILPDRSGICRIFFALCIKMNFAALDAL